MSPLDLTRPLLVLLIVTFVLFTFEFIGDLNPSLVQLTLAAIGLGLMLEGIRNSNRTFKPHGSNTAK